MAFDASFYPNLLTFSTIGFTVFISGAFAREIILEDVRIVKWYFRLYAMISRVLIIPGIVLAISAVPILWSLICENLHYASYGLYLQFVSYLLAVTYLPAGFILGFIYLSLEKHFLKKFKAELKSGGFKDFLE